MGYPQGVSQKTWSATVSEPVTASLLRQNVTDPAWLLSSPPMAILAQQVSADTIPATTPWRVRLDTELVDTLGVHSDAVSTDRCYCAVTGWYLIRGAVAFAQGAGEATSSFTAGVFVTDVSTGITTQTYGGIFPGTSGASVIPTFTELAVLVATNFAKPAVNDYCSMFTYIPGSWPLQITLGSGIYSWLSSRWVGTATGTAGLPVPSNPGFSDAAAISGAFLNANVRDAVNFLSFPPMARLTQTSRQSIPSQAFPAGTPVTFTSAAAQGTSASSDNYGGWSPSANPTRYTFPRAGRYYAYGQAAFTGGGGGNYAAGLRVNGGTTAWGTRTLAAGLGAVPTAEQYLRVNAGDYVELIASQNSGSAVNTTTGQASCRLIVLWEGS